MGVGENNGFERSLNNVVRIGDISLTRPNAFEGPVSIQRMCGLQGRDALIHIFSGERLLHLLRYVGGRECSSRFQHGTE